MNNNLTINQQKEFEKLIAKISELETQLLQQEKEHREEIQHMQNIQNKLSNEYSDMKVKAKHYQDYSNTLKNNLVTTIKEMDKLKRDNSRLQKQINTYDDRELSGYTEEEYNILAEAYANNL